jgi:hypothetical protein
VVSVPVAHVRGGHGICKVVAHIVLGIARASAG